jgi:hypothetical protein
MKSGSFNLLKPSGPVQAYTVTALPVPLSSLISELTIFLLWQGITTESELRICAR